MIATKPLASIPKDASTSPDVVVFLDNLYFLDISTALIADLIAICFLREKTGLLLFCAGNQYKRIARSISFGDFIIAYPDKIVKIYYNIFNILFQTLILYLMSDIEVVLSVDSDFV